MSQDGLLSATGSSERKGALQAGSGLAQDERLPPAAPLVASLVVTLELGEKR